MASVVASIALPMWQEHTMHLEQLKQANELHSQAIFQAEKHFQQGLKLDCVLHKREMSLARELHYAQMAHDMEIARRESIRDVWSQRNQLAQTLMVVDTLMFGCAFSILVEGVLPDTTPSEVTQIYAVVLALSLGFLFVSIWFSLNLQARMGKYDMHQPFLKYTCGQTHKNFNQYFDCHCKKISQHALWTFYTGTVLCIVSGSILFFSRLRYTYQNDIAGYLFVSIVGVSLLIVPFGQSIWSSQTRDDGGEEDFGGLGGGELPMEPSNPDAMPMD